MSVFKNLKQAVFNCNIKELVAGETETAFEPNTRIKNHITYMKNRQKVGFFELRKVLHFTENSEEMNY